MMSKPQEARYLSHPLALEHRKTWGDLFEATSFDKAHAPAPMVVHLVGIGPHDTERMEVGPYCTIDRSNVGGPAHTSAWVRMRPDAWAELLRTRGVLGIEHDRMSFEVIQWNDAEALVVLQHGLIIGPIWLSIIDPTTIPSADGERSVTP